MTKHRAPRALLWDNDGVLVDSEALFFQATREILAQDLGLRILQLLEVALQLLRLDGTPV